MENNTFTMTKQEKIVFEGVVRSLSERKTYTQDKETIVNTAVVTGLGDFGSAKVVVSGCGELPFIQGEDVKLEFSQPQSKLKVN